MDGYSCLSSDEDSDSEWVTTAESSREITQPKQPSSEQSPAENTSQQTLSGRLWSLVPSFGVWGATAGVQGDQKSVDAGALDDTMATNQADEQKKPGWLKWKKLAAAEVMQRVKTTWKSEEETEDSDKRVENEEEDVFSIILRDKTELQAKNTKLLKKIAELERKVKERESQVEKKERELQNLIEKRRQRDKPHPLQRQSSYEKVVTSSQGSIKTKAKDQEIHSLRQLDNLESVKLEDEKHILEISRKDEEIRQLKENIERLRNQKSTAETGMETITKQVEYFEIQYCTEKKHTQRLQDEIKQLQQQLDLVPLSEPGKSSGGEEGSAKIIAHLRNRIKQLTDDTSKLKEHSLEQSRAVLSLRQQAEMSKYMEEQVQSMEVLLSETEGERDHLRKLLSERSVEHHRGTRQEVSMADIQAQNQELKEKLTQAEAQALVYKSDFEEERRDRERVHGLIDDLKEKKTQVEGRAEQKIAAYKQTLEEVNQDLQYTKEQLHKHKVLLADTETLNKKRVEEAQKAKNEADAARCEADKYYQESEQFRQSTEYWRNQAEASKRDTQCIQAKASQVKQYAKEVEKLKQQRSAAQQNTKVLTDMFDKVTKERDQLKRQNLQLSKKNEQLKKKRKSLTDKVLASPDLPPEEDSTLIELEFAQQQADEADKRANAAEMRAMAAEKQAKAAEMKQHGAEARIAKREKQLDGTYVQVQAETYQSDFELERKDRERAHGMMADMEEHLAQLKGHASVEKAAYENQIDVLKNDLQVLADLEHDHREHLQETRKEMNHWREEAIAAKSELQAKESRMKHYADENDKLKLEDQQLKQQANMLHTILTDSYVHLQQQLQWTNQQIMQFVETMKVDDHLTPFKIRQFQLKQQLGSGAWGSIYAAEIDSSGCIAKRLHDILIGAGREENISQQEYQALTQKFHQECLFLSQVRHPNIVQFMGVHCSDKNRSDMTLFMERLPIDLHRCTIACRDKQYELPLPIKISVLCDVCNGITHLHQSNIIHRDLSASNVLLTHDLRAKIADLGVSKILEQDWIRRQKLSNAPGALAYMPPEALNDSCDYDTKLDVFSFGVIALFLAIQEFPMLSWERAPDHIFMRGEESLWMRRKWIKKMGDNHPLKPIVHQCLLIKEKRPATRALDTILKQLRAQYPSHTKDYLDSFMHLGSLLKF